jgi:hypothetical protein
VSTSNPNNQKFVKQLIERGTKILKVPNPADPLKARDGEISVHKARFVLLRLLSPEAGNHRLKNFSHLSLQSLNLIIRRLKSFSQLVCKIKEKIHYWTSTWCRSGGMILRKDLYELGEKAHLKSWNLWKFKQITSTTVNFSKNPSVRYCTESCWTTYFWKDLNRNLSKNNTTKNY